MANPTVVTWEPYLAIENRLEDGRDFFEKVLKERDFLKQLAGSDVDKKKVGKIAFGEKTRFAQSDLLGIRIIPATLTPEWLAMRSRKDRYYTYIDAMIRNSIAEVIPEMIVTFAGAITQWLLDFNSLSTPIPEINMRAIQSWITRVTYGHTVGRAWRVARIEHWMDLHHVYTDVRQGANACT